MNTCLVRLPSRINMRILKHISSIMQHSISLLIRSIDQTQLSDLLLPFLHLFLVNPEDKFQSGKNTNTFRSLVRESPSLFVWNSHNQSLLIFITDLLEHCFPRLKQLRYLRKIPNITRNSTNQNRRSRRFETLTISVKRSIFSRMWLIESSTSSDPATFVSNSSLCAVSESEIAPSPSWRLW